MRRLDGVSTIVPFASIALLSTACASLPPASLAPSDPYVAAIEVIPAAEDASPAEAVRGVVFYDANQDGARQETETGVAGVMVSNGRDVVQTDAAGAYALPVREDMSVFVVQPAGWRTPTNADWVPQFAYQHKPAGSPKPLRYGGLPPTGPLPEAINFPLIPAGRQDAFSCAVLGDTQTYANAEISFLRDSTVDDILDRGPGAVDCVIAVGDVMGDDLDLIPRMADVLGVLRAPQWWAHGNHDFDFDADFDADSADSWRRLWGPAHYAFEMGEVLFIVLDNVVYPCTAEDAALPGRERCVEHPSKRYNARITEDQMAFVRQLLSFAGPDKTVVFAHHIPFVSFVDQTTTAHQTDNINDLYALVAEAGLDPERVLSLSGHTHTITNLSPGDSFAGWKDAVNVEAIPFRHIITGAASGAWWQGDYDHHGVPMALQRQGAPRGWLEVAFDKGAFVETYHGANTGRERAMWLSINTPEFRVWYEEIMAWRAQQWEDDTLGPVPPLSVQDLPDVKLLTPEDLEGGSYLTANIWAGSTETTATVSLNGGPETPLVRTQEARGEEARIGPDFADPFAVQRQLTVARMAIESTGGDMRDHGYESFQGRAYGPTTPAPQGSVADRSAHLWRVALPEGLPEGAHVAVVRVTDRHGRVYEDSLAFEVRAKRPPHRWRDDVWDAFENGPPVR